MKTLLVPVTALAALVLLTACATKPPATTAPASGATSGAAAAPSRLSAVYDCGTDRIAARFAGNSVTIGLPDGRSLMLPKAGAGYSDGSITFSESNGAATVETPTQSWRDCRPIG